MQRFVNVFSRIIIAYKKVRLIGVNVKRMVNVWPFYFHSSLPLISVFVNVFSHFLLMSLLTFLSAFLYIIHNAVVIGFSACLF